MLKFLSRKTKTEFVNPAANIKDWKDSQHEIESMGVRLDAIRHAVSKCKEGTWAHNHWSQIEAIVLRKWTLMISLQQSGLRQVGPDRGIPIDYHWWEGSDEIRGLIPTPSFINNLFNQSNLEWSWANAQEQKLQKARLGQA